MGSNPTFPTIFNKDFAGVAELADALDLGSSDLRRGGSSPFTRTSFRLYISAFHFIESLYYLASAGRPIKQKWKLSAGARYNINK